MDAVCSLDLTHCEQLSKPLREIPDHHPGSLHQFGETKSLFDLGYHRERLANGTDIVLLGNLFRRGAPEKLRLVERTADKTIFLVPEDKFEKMRDPEEVKRISAETNALVNSLNTAWASGTLPREALR